jgi:hypothetical protein
MRYSRRLPPFMRVVIALALLLCVAEFVLLLLAKLYWSPLHVPSADFGRLVIIASYLASLDLACIDVIVFVSIRMLMPGRRWRIPLDSWQSQARALALAGVGPLCGLIVTLANAPSFGATSASAAINAVALCWPLAVMAPLVGWPSQRLRLSGPDTMRD